DQGTTTGDTTTTGPTTQDLGGILAGATNKTVTPSQVKAIVEHLAETNPDDTALGGLATSLDDKTCQDIADAANATSSDDSSTTDTSSTDTSSTDTSTDTSDTTSSGEDHSTTTTTTTTSIVVSGNTE